MNILLLGHSGYLGAYLLKRLIIRSEWPDGAPFIVTSAVSEHQNIDLIINCIGIPDLNYCESNKQKCIHSNYQTLLHYHNMYPNAKIITFSTYYVYNDIGFCDEEDITTKLYCYMRCKLLSESVALGSSGIAFRLGKLFGKSPKGAPRLTKAIIKGTAGIALDHVLFNPTSLEQIFDVIKYTILEDLPSGIYNLANNGFTTHYEYGKFIGKNFNLKQKIISKSLHHNFASYGNFLMSTKKLSNFIRLRPWERDLMEYLKC